MGRGLIGESGRGDCQDCGVSALLYMGEPPCHPPGQDSSSFPQVAGTVQSCVTRKRRKCGCLRRKSGTNPARPEQISDDE